MQNSAHYFNSIIRSSKCYTIDSIIAVLHICRGSIQFLEAISSFTRVAGVIPKQSSKIFGSLKNVSENYHVLDYARSEIISKQEIFLGEISSLARNQKFAIIDIGGYFAAVYPTLVNRFGDKLIGVVEDTENASPIHIDIHQIPENPIKNEPGHLHVDLMYKLDVIERDASSEDILYQWIEFGEVKNERLDIVLKKLRSQHL
ncbi:hypothetical protein G6692_02635 [Polynucleobacter paneuropaeus]|nr:hypothetical protein [Polynucleobacter paneuropaeus]